MHNRHHPQLQTVKLHRQSGGGRDAQQRLGDGFRNQGVSQLDMDIIQ
jgi:hypothetical protein